MREFYASDSRGLLVRFDTADGVKYINSKYQDWQDADDAVLGMLFRGGLDRIDEAEADALFKKLKEKVV